MHQFLKRYLCGDDDSLFDDFQGPADTSGEQYYTNANDLTFAFAWQTYSFGVTASAFG